MTDSTRPHDSNRRVSCSSLFSDLLPTHTLQLLSIMLTAAGAAPSGALRSVGAGQRKAGCARMRVRAGVWSDLALLTVSDACMHAGGSCVHNGAGLDACMLVGGRVMAKRCGDAPHRCSVVVRLCILLLSATSRHRDQSVASSRCRITCYSITRQLAAAWWSTGVAWCPRSPVSLTCPVCTFSMIPSSAKQA